MTTTSFDLDRVYTELPLAFLREMQLTHIPLEYKQEFIAAMQSELSARVEIMLLDALREPAVLDEIEMVLASDESIEGLDLMRYIVQAIPNYEDRYQQLCQEIMQEFLISHD